MSRERPEVIDRRDGVNDLVETLESLDGPVDAICLDRSSTAASARAAG